MTKKLELATHEDMPELPKLAIWDRIVVLDFYIEKCQFTALAGPCRIFGFEVTHSVGHSSADIAHGESENGGEGPPVDLVL